MVSSKVQLVLNKTQNLTSITKEITMIVIIIKITIKIKNGNYWQLIWLKFQEI